MTDANDTRDDKRAVDEPGPAAGSAADRMPGDAVASGAAKTRPQQASAPGDREGQGRRRQGAQEPVQSEPEQAADAGRSLPPPRAARGASLGLALVALSVGGAAVVACGYLWLQYRNVGDRLAAADDEQRIAIERTDQTVTELADTAAALTRDISDVRDRLSAVRLEIGDFPSQIGALSQRVDALQGGRADSREIWLRAEAEYYLAVANAELALTGRIGNAVTALTLADGLLRELGDPALNPVRVAIAEELANLRATELPDHEGIAFSLAGLAGRVPELPFRGAPSTRYAGEGRELDDMEPGIGRLWASLKGAVLGIVRIERRDAPVEVLLTATDQAMVRRELVLELQLARIALLRDEPRAFRASLDAATALLEQEFDVESASVAGMLGQLGELSALDIAPPRPDISGSLNLLRSTTGGAD